VDHAFLRERVKVNGKGENLRDTASVQNHHD